MAQWIALLIPALVAIIGAAVVFGAVKSTGAETRVGQEKLTSIVEGLVLDVAALSTGAAVNSAQRDELSRRIGGIEGKLSEHSEHIRVLRTKTHMNSNKLMEMDPKWRPYQHEDV